MRRKKHKASRRIVRFYKLHFGFREPFKVLMDGNFLHAVSQMKYDNLEDQISTLLGAKVRLFVPSCVMRELRDMAKTDKAYQAAVALARKFVRHKDACPPTESTSDILLQQIGQGNEQHWWLATQDKALWATLQEDERNPVPLLYVSTTGLHLLPVSDALQKGIADKTMDHMTAGEAEQEMLEAGAAKPAPMARGFKKKPAAPNPLSVKSKSKVEKSEQPSGTNRRKRRPGVKDAGT